MSEPRPNIGTIISKWLGKAIGGPISVSKSIKVATYSVAEFLLWTVGASLVFDIRRIKEAKIREIEAEADCKKAEAQIREAEGIEAANRANFPKRRDKLAEIERERRALENAKTEAEIEMLQAKTEAIRIETKSKAKSRFIEAISKLKQDGGALFVDEQNLRRLTKEEPWDPVEEFNSTKSEPEEFNQTEQDRIE